MSDKLKVIFQRNDYVNDKYLILDPRLVILPLSDYKVRIRLS